MNEIMVTLDSKRETSEDPTAVATDFSGIFVDESHFTEYFMLSGAVPEPSAVKRWIDSGFIPVFQDGPRRLYLASDLDSIRNCVQRLDPSVVTPPTRLSLFDYEEKTCLNIGGVGQIDLPCSNSNMDPIIYSALRNLLDLDFSKQELSSEVNCNYFSETIVTTGSSKLQQIIAIQMSRNASVDVTRTSQFARSAHYMGSKRALCGFLVEGISSVLPDTGVIVDLMCGSGVTSGAFSRIWETYSSDAQEFCRTLSIVHGSGFDQRSAKDVISKLSSYIKFNFESLENNLKGWLDTEENLFCQDIDDNLLAEYKSFLSNFPSLTCDSPSKSWDPKLEISRRVLDNGLFPYCLFTCYFANVYFGVRQCAEIDSLRYAIDQLQDPKEKTWALGALIATLSALGTTYGGHFAQPGVDLEKISLPGLSQILNTRSFSITHEFAVRLFNLAEQGALASQEVKTVPGPWRSALHALQDELSGRQVLVYLDPPYKREEYSRYYHVLETAIRYNYPSLSGKGLTPKPGERFRSEFFTKRHDKVEVVLTDIILEVLQRGWMCGWSYADTGMANIVKVVENVHAACPCRIKSFVVPFIHNSQGGASPKKVNEYLIIFSPQSN